MPGCAIPTDPARVRALDNALRRSFTGGRVMLTAGVAALPEGTRAAVFAAVRAFDIISATPPVSAARRSLWCLPLIAAALLPAACSAQTPSCSDERVGAKVKELVLQRLSENYGLTAMYDLPATRFDLRAIRTVASDERRSDCRTDLAMEFELNSELKAVMAKPSGNPTEAQMMRSMLGNNSRSVDLRYSVERTDDGKDLYVSIQRF